MLVLLLCAHQIHPVAINYALTRTFHTPETHIIYDAGAGSIRATVVTFSTGPSSDSNKSSAKSKSNTTSIETKAIGYARGTGGNELDRRLREILIEDFNTKHNKDIRTDARGMAKLWKEAGRVKAVLSANSDAATTVWLLTCFGALCILMQIPSIQVESVAFDIDYRSKISRATFEEALADLKPTFTRPITDALDRVGLTLVSSKSSLSTHLD